MWTPKYGHIKLYCGLHTACIPSYRFCWHNLLYPQHYHINSIHASTIWCWNTKSASSRLCELINKVVCLHLSICVKLSRKWTLMLYNVSNLFIATAELKRMLNGVFLEWNGKKHAAGIFHQEFCGSRLEINRGFVLIAYSFRRSHCYHKHLFNIQVCIPDFLANCAKFHKTIRHKSATN